MATTAQEMSSLEGTVAALREDYERSLSANATSQRDLQESLVSAKHDLLRVQEQLAMAEKDLEKKFQQTAAYRNMKEILTKKNEQIKDIRKRLQKFSSGGGLGFSGALGGGGGMALAPYAGGAGGAGLGFGLRSGAGLGLGLGLGMGGGGGGGGFGLGGGGGSMVMAGPAFALGRTMAVGGVSAGASSLTAGRGVSSAVAPVLSRAAEKQTLSSLNQRFASYMTAVRQLQQENAALEARLAQLTGGIDTSPETSASTADHEAQVAEQRGKMESLTVETVRLEIELDGVRGAAHELKAKYDFEQGVKFQLEADIAAMKRDIEVASDLRIELDAKHSSLKEDLDYINKAQEEELFSLQAKLGTTSSDSAVSMIEVDTGKSFDISSALNKMRMEYEKSVQEHREEADSYYRLKIDEVQAASASSAEALSSAKMEVSSAKKELQALSLELQTLLNLNAALEGSLVEAQAMSTGGAAEHQAQIASLEAAIEVAKGDLHKQILSYQELLDIKLALDAEIATYRSLLDGDDISFAAHSYESAASLLGSPGPSQANSTRAEDK